MQQRPAFYFEMAALNEALDSIQDRKAIEQCRAAPCWIAVVDIESTNNGILVHRLHALNCCDSLQQSILKALIMCDRRCCFGPQDTRGRTVTTSNVSTAFCCVITMEIVSLNSENFLNNSN